MLLRGVAEGLLPDLRELENDTQGEQTVRVDVMRQISHGLAVCCNANGRREGLLQFLKWAGEATGAQQTRVVIGSDKVDEVWDGRLGKLKRDSILWEKASTRWEGMSPPSDDCAHGSGDSFFFLTQNGLGGVVGGYPHKRQKVALWLSGNSLDRAFLESLAMHGEAFEAALLNRPRYARRLRLTAEQRGWLTWIGFVVTMVLGIGLFPRPYQVACGVTVHSIGERIIAAPFESTLLECAVAPGDEVEVGDLLLRLDGRPLILELEALKAEYSQASQENSLALASGRIADAQVAELECKRIKSRIQMVQDRMDRLEILSPIRGVIVSGDLENSVGRPFELGDALLEISPLDHLKIEVEIPEADIHFVNVGNDVRARLDSAVFSPLDGQLQRVYPQAEVREEKNCFIASLEYENDRGFVRPGMTGKAVVYGANRPMLHRWLRPLIEGTLRAIGW